MGAASSPWPPAPARRSPPWSSPARSLNAFQTRLRPRVAAGNVHHLLIADEVYNLGAENARNALPDSIALRHGLSATPERHFDPVGTAAVLDYFDAIVYAYTLAQAIADGRLCCCRCDLPMVDWISVDSPRSCEHLTRNPA